MDERRRATRQAVDKQASVVSPKLFARSVIRDISTSGACIELQSQAMLPDKFRLQIPSYDTFTVSLVWHEGLQAGVAFGEPIREHAVTTLSQKRKRPPHGVKVGAAAHGPKDDSENT